MTTGTRTGAPGSRRSCMATKGRDIFIPSCKKPTKLAVLGSLGLTTFAAFTFLVPSEVKHIKKHLGARKKVKQPKVCASKCTT